MPVETKTCQTCRETKSLDDFYANPKGLNGRMPYCKTCDNSRPRRASAGRINRMRARARATADLVAAHRKEWEGYLEVRLVEAKAEAEELAKQATDEHEEPVRLKPGPRMPGQVVGDRIDVARCPTCIKSHDRGHVCPACGTKPGDRIPPGINPRDLQEFNAGTQRAAGANRR